MRDDYKEPVHYPKRAGLSCKDIAQEFNFNIGNVIKYVWRCGLKGHDAIDDLKKAKDYIDFEIQRLQNEKLAFDLSNIRKSDLDHSGALTVHAGPDLVKSGFYNVRSYTQDHTVPVKEVTIQDSIIKSGDTPFV